MVLNELWISTGSAPVTSVIPKGTTGMILIGLAVGVAMSIAVQAAADDLASRRNSRGDQA
ncbi:hypothetical protein M3195_03720 [Microbacterium hydrocarbonoxydans]|nr:hypothetical protein [Microbacterium hydrocarbonoxydans]